MAMTNHHVPDALLRISHWFLQSKDDGETDGEGTRQGGRSQLGRRTHEWNGSIRA